MSDHEAGLPERRGDDPDRWRSRKWRGDLAHGRMQVREFKALVLVHRWEIWKRGSK